MKNISKLLIAFTLLSASISFGAEAPPSKRARAHESPIHATQYSSINSGSQTQNSLESTENTYADVNFLQLFPKDLTSNLILPKLATANTNESAQTICRLARTNKAFKDFINTPDVMLNFLNACPTNQDKKHMYELLKQSSNNTFTVLNDEKLTSWFKKIKQIIRMSTLLYTQTARSDLPGLQQVIKEAKESGIPLDINARYPIFFRTYLNVMQCTTTALMTASSQHNPEILRLLIAEGADIEQKEEGGGTALSSAATGGPLENVRILLAHGASVTSDDRLLIKAAFCGPQMVELLLNAGLDPRIGSKSLSYPRNMATANGEITLITMLDEAVKKAQQKSQEKSRAKALHPKPLLHGLPERIKQPLADCLAAKNPAKVAQRFFDYAMKNPEFVADMQDPAYLKKFFKALPFKQARTELAKYFRNAQSLIHQGKTLFVPGLLDEQIEELKKEKFAYAFEKDKRLSRWLQKTNDHLEDCQELVIAANNDDLAAVLQLLKNRYLDLNSEICITALANAILTNNTPIASALLNAGVNPDALIRTLNYSKCAPEMIQLLVEYGADPRNILFYAAHGANISLSKLLIAAGGHMQHDGKTLLMQAAQDGNTRLIQTLLAAGVDPSERNPHDGNRTALDYLNHRKKRFTQEDKHIADLLNEKN